MGLFPGLTAVLDPLAGSLGLSPGALLGALGSMLGALGAGFSLSGLEVLEGAASQTRVVPYRTDRLGHHILVSLDGCLGLGHALIGEPQFGVHLHLGGHVGGGGGVGGKLPGAVDRLVGVHIFLDHGGFALSDGYLTTLPLGGCLTTLSRGSFYALLLSLGFRSLSALWILWGLGPGSHLLFSASSLRS